MLFLFHNQKRKTISYLYEKKLSKVWPRLEHTSSTTQIHYYVYYWTFKITDDLLQIHTKKLTHVNNTLRIQPSKNVAVTATRKSAKYESECELVHDQSCKLFRNLNLIISHRFKNPWNKIFLAFFFYLNFKFIKLCISHRYDGVSAIMARPMLPVPAYVQPAAAAAAAAAGARDSSRSS